MDQDDQLITEEILNELRNLVEKDQALRDEYEIGDRYRAIRNKLVGIVKEAEQALAEQRGNVAQDDAVQETFRHPSDQQEVVYVYLFNSAGKRLASWAGMFTADALLDYATNRPIYQNKEDAVAVVRSRKEKSESAILAVIIERAAIIPDGSGKRLGPLGHPLLKIKERALQPGSIVYFYHNDQYYTINVSTGLPELVYETPDI